jgi:hypothetical protein
MHATDDDDQIVGDHEEDLIGEPLEGTSSRPTVHDPISRWMLSDPLVGLE